MSEAAPNSPTTPPGAPIAAAYSKAFENFVSASDDIVGLLGYALYKEGVGQEAKRGVVTPGVGRDPSPAVVAAFRQAAEQRLTQVVNLALEEATPELQESALLAAMRETEVAIKGHIADRTSFGSALLTNIIAWLVTLAITVLLIIIAGRPAVEQAIAHLLAPAPAGQVAPPSASTPIANDG